MTPPGFPAQDGSSKMTVDARQLEALERLANVGALASSVTHEFNNILTTILNQAKLGTRAAESEAARRCFEKILDSARRASKITTGVLALARGRSSKIELVDVAELVEQVLTVCDKDLRKHFINLQCDFGNRPKAEIVPSQIEQVILNLIINARQAMEKGGTLTVAVQENIALGTVEILIRDTGCGIPAENLPRIFEPFYSTKQGPDESGHGGSGLGLSLCKEIIGRHQGRIRVESTVGKGTTFTIKLPKKIPNGTPAHAA